MSKEAILFTQQRYASDVLVRTAKNILPASFLSSVDNIARNLTLGSIPHLGAKIVCSELAAAGYRPRIENLFDENALMRAKAEAELILVSAMDIGTDRAENILNKVRNKPVLLGGYGITASSERFLNRFPQATVILGEGEELVRQALSDLAVHGEFQPSYKRTTPYDLTNYFSHPAMDEKLSLPMFSRSNLKVIEASRGCREGCEFCLTAKQPVSVKPLETLVREIEAMNIKPWNVLFFVDQNLLVCPRDYLVELFNYINSKGYKWIGEGTIGYVLQDEKLIKLMAKNCLTFLVGIEDLFSPTKGSKEKNGLKKNFDSAVKTLREYKLPVLYSLMFGTDNQSSEVFDMTAEKILETGITVATHIATPRPGTPFWQTIVDSGRLRNKASVARNMRLDAVHDTAQMTREELLIGYARFQQKVYSPDRVVERFIRNVAECGSNYAAGLLVGDLVYAVSTVYYLKKHEALLKSRQGKDNVQSSRFTVACPSVADKHT